MLFRHADKRLAKVDEDADYKGALSDALVKAFRMRMQAIRAAVNENDLRRLKSLHFEKLKGGQEASVFDATERPVPPDLRD